MLLPAPAPAPASTGGVDNEIGNGRTKCAASLSSGAWRALRQGLKAAELALVTAWMRWQVLLSCQVAAAPAVPLKKVLHSSPCTHRHAAEWQRAGGEAALIAPERSAFGKERYDVSWSSLPGRAALAAATPAIGNRLNMQRMSRQPPGPPPGPRVRPVIGGFLLAPGSEKTSH